MEAGRGDHMKRREFIALIGGATTAYPLRVWSQQAPRRAIIGVLSPISAAAAARNIEALRAGLRELGYIEDRNITLELRFAEGAIERLPDLAAELLALNPDVIVAGSPPAALAVQKQTRVIPIVMNSTTDPVGLGLARSMARPGGNVTGLWWGDEVLIGKRLELLKQTVPGISRVGVFLNPTDVTNIDDLRSLPAAAARLGLATRVFELRAASEFQTAFDTAKREGLHGLHVSLAPLFISNRIEVVRLAASVRLPAIYGFREFPVAGGLMSYGTSLADLYRRKGALIDKILKGASPADLPIERPTKFELVLNLKTAHALGLGMPAALLSLTDEVIE